MGNTNIKQIKSALIRHGIPDWKINGMTEYQLKQLCNEKLCEALTGTSNTGKFDKFIKNYEYNILYPLNNETKIQVHKLGVLQLTSGRKIETFIDIAGNQYFQYRAADNKIINENYFRKQENFHPFDKLVYRNNKLYKEDIVGNIQELKALKNDMQNPTIHKNPAPKILFGGHKKISQISRYEYNNDIVLTSDCNVDLSVYSLEYLRYKYNANSYNMIKTTPLSGYATTLKVINKLSGKHECTISYNNNSIRIESGNKKFIVHNGVLKEYIQSKDSKYIVLEYKKNKFINKFIDKKHNIYVEESGTIGDEANSNIYSPFLDEIHNKLNKNSINGKKIVDGSIVQDIMNNLDKENSNNIYYMYKKKFGTEIAQELTEGLGLSQEVKLKLLKHLNWKEYGIKYLVQTLKLDINKPQNNTFEEHLKTYVDKNNIISFLKEFCDEPQIYDFNLYKFVFGNGEFEERKALLLDITQNAIQAIAKNTTLSAKTKKICIDHIVKMILECPYIEKDITDDIKTNKDDLKKLTIDVNRIITRRYDCYIEKRNDKELLETLKNKTFNIAQGKTGDCWLLSVIISAYNKNPNFISKLISVDDKNKKVTVHLRGENKKYTFSYEQLLAADHLDRKNLKIRAIEMAVDRYYRDIGYKHFNQGKALTSILSSNRQEKLKYKYFDINSNSVSNSVKILFNTKIKQFNTDKNSHLFDFSKNCYVLAADGNKLNLPYTCKDAYDQNIEIIPNHDYSVLKTDDNYVYLINPWDSTKVIVLPWERLKNIPHIFDCFTLN